MTMTSLFHTLPVYPHKRGSGEKGSCKGGRAGTVTAGPANARDVRDGSDQPIQLMEAFNQLTLHDFELWLINKKGRLILDPH